MKISKHVIVINYLNAGENETDHFRVVSSPIEINCSVADAQALAAFISGFRNIIITKLHTSGNREYVFESGRMRDEPHWPVSLTEEQIEAILNGLRVAENEGLEGDFHDAADAVYAILSPLVEEQ